jgi:hypothetical protein
MAHRRQLKSADGTTILPFTTNVPVHSAGGLTWGSGSAGDEKLQVKLTSGGGIAAGLDGLYIKIASGGGLSATEDGLRVIGSSGGSGGSGSGGDISGAIVSGAAFVTTVGNYTLGLTSGGILMSGANVSVGLASSSLNIHVSGNSDVSADIDMSMDDSGQLYIGLGGADAVFGIYTDQSPVLVNGLPLYVDYDNADFLFNDEVLATQPWVSSYVSSHGGGGSVSGAIVSGAEFSTTVGSYTVALTSGGGLLVSGSEMQFRLSSGGMIASGTSGECVVLSGGTAKLMNNYDDVEQSVTVEHDGGVSIHAADPGRNVDIVCDAGDINLNTSYGGAVKINDVPVITQLIRAVDSSFNTSAQVRVSGGTHYIYPNPLDQLMVGVAEDSRESYIQFTLTSSGVLIVPSTLALLNSGIEFDGGKTYLLGFLNGMMAAGELTEGTGSYGSFAVKFWDTGNIYNFSFFSGDFYNQYYLCADLPGYSIVINQHDDNGQNTQGSFYGPGGTLLSSGEGAGDDIAGIGWDSEDYSIQYVG